MLCSLVKASLSKVLRELVFWLCIFYGCYFCVCRDPSMVSSPGFLADFSQQMSFGALNTSSWAC